MPAADANGLPTLGFLTLQNHAHLGLMGGYLVLNTAGRPVEFHCTAPIKPNRAQQILYGPTLEPFLYGEQIGQALLGKSQRAPLAIFTDLKPALAVRPFITMPVALVVAPPVEQPVVDQGLASALPAHSGEATATSGWSAAGRLRLDEAHANPAEPAIFQLGRNRLATSPNRDDDRVEILRRLEPLIDLFDLGEPFHRIREAIEEAQRMGR